MHTNLNLKHKCLFLRILWHITKSKSAASVAKHFFVVEHFQEKFRQKLIKSEERIPFMLSKAPRLCGLSRLESRHTVLVSQKSVHVLFPAYLIQSWLFCSWNLFTVGFGSEFQELIKSAGGGGGETKRRSGRISTTLHMPPLLRFLFPKFFLIFLLCSTFLDITSSTMAKVLSPPVPLSDWYWVLLPLHNVCRSGG